MGLFYVDYISGAGISPDGLLENLTPRSESLRPVASQIITVFYGWVNPGFNRNRIAGYLLTIPWMTINTSESEYGLRIRR